jgi:hypothetical protein
MTPGRREGTSAGRAPVRGYRTRPPQSGMTMALVVGGAVVLLGIAGIGIFLARHKAEKDAERRHQEMLATGCSATRRLIDPLKVVAQEYLDFRKNKPKENWTIRKLEAAGLAVPAELCVEDVILLSGSSTLVASISGTPRQLSGAAERAPDPAVAIRNGKYMAGPEGGLRCVYFQTTMDMAGQKDFTIILIAVPREALK